jgi:hypothetical protein
VVADRGMVSKATLDAFESSDPPVGYIVGVRMRRQMGLVERLHCIVYRPTAPPSVIAQPQASAPPTVQRPEPWELQQNGWGGPNHSVVIDDAIKKSLRDPDSFKFISATLWRKDDSYPKNAWICQAKYRAKNGFAGYNTEETSLILDRDGCRILNPILDKKPSPMTARERKTMKQTVKLLHDRFNG